MVVSVSVSSSASMSGDAVTDGEEPMMVDVFVLVVGVPPAGDGFTIVVLVSVAVPGDPAAGATVSVLSSQLARSAALAMMQKYFFIMRRGGPTWVKGESNGASRLALPAGDLRWRALC